MLTLGSDRILGLDIPVSASRLLGDCMEARGKQDLWITQKPEVLGALRELAIVQSAESSNRIEGVTISADRLRPVVLGRAKPRDRSEEELAGYRRALEWIYTRKRRVILAPSVIQHLHKLSHSAAADAGMLKARDNEIIEILPSDERRVRFRPTPAKQTSSTLRRLCAEYERICAGEQLPSLLSVATFVFDLLCIHPFRDGNGRVSRLAATLLLQQHGFIVSRFVSLERLTEQRKEEYYDALARCSKGWHEDRNEIVPWWNFFLGIIRSAYKELAEQVESAESRPAKGELVRRAALAQPDAFTLADVAAQVPTASQQLIKKVLSGLKRSGKIKLIGHGRGAYWRVIH